MSDFLFAYGTLQPGCVPAKIARLAKKLRPLGVGFVHGAVYDLGRYPGAIADALSKGEIFGTVMELPEDPDFLRELDAYEGYDPQEPKTSEYIRERQTVEMSDGRSVDCWFYRFNGKADPARAIASGVWSRKRESGP
jgi:gamma-glutamylcyclotransferase (GGCT)/AIG2-like uncharacterized protein YtfP